MSTSEQFKTIPFDKVYHEGGIGGDSSIISHRCAEVLVPSPMLLADRLRWIYCRSDAERATLIYALGSNSLDWSRRIRVSDDLKVFEKRYVFVESVSLANDGVVFRLNPRQDRQPIMIRIEITDIEGNRKLFFSNNALPATPPNALAWKAKGFFGAGAYRAVIYLDSHKAYEAWLKLDNAPF